VKASVTSRGRGLRGLSRALDETEVIDDALRASAQEVAAEAREGLERDGGPGTRALANSLEVPRGPKPLSYRVVSLAPRAWFREFGSLSRAQQPWLRPALERARSRIVRRVGKTIQRITTRRHPGRGAAR